MLCEARPGIALVNPSNILHGAQLKIEPVALTHLAAVLEREGYPVAIFDFEVLFEHEDYEETLLEIAKFPIVGVSYYSFAMPEKYDGGSQERPRLSPLQFVRDIKKVRPECTVIVGGPGVTSSSKWLLREYPEVDFAIKGEAEDLLPQLLRALYQRSPLSSIRGLTYRQGDEIVANPGVGVQLDLDALPPPARHLLRLKHLYRPTMVSSRGCPHLCAFCQPENPNKFRARSAARVLDEIEFLVRQEGVPYIDFVDPNFSAVPRRVEEILDGLIERNLSVWFSITATSNTLFRRPELVDKLQAGGCVGLNLGCESFIQRRLDEWHTAKKVRFHAEAIRTLRRAKLGFVASFILFDQKTTLDDLRQELSMMESLEIIDYVDEYSNRLRLFTGSALNMEEEYRDWEFECPEVRVLYSQLLELLAIQSELFELRSRLLNTDYQELSLPDAFSIGHQLYRGLRLVKQQEHGVIAECLLDASKGELSPMRDCLTLAQVKRLREVLSGAASPDIRGDSWRHLKFQRRSNVRVILRADPYYMMAHQEMGRIHYVNATALLLLQLSKEPTTGAELFQQLKKVSKDRDERQVAVEMFAALALLHSERLLDEIPYVQPTRLDATAVPYKPRATEAALAA